MPKPPSKMDTIAMENLLCYLKIPTVHPNPDYKPAIQWLRGIAADLGLTCSVLELTPNNPIMIMCWKGSCPELPAILLNSHMDVVPVDQSEWTFPPFGATVTSEGMIYARGVQDMKSVGVQQLEAVRRLQYRGYSQLRRTVYITFVPDEEMGGTLGMRPFVLNKPAEKQKVTFGGLNIGFCLDEGLASTTDAYVAYVAERRHCWFHAHFYGRAGHGLNLIRGTAAEKYHSFLNRIMEFRESELQRLEDPTSKLNLGDVTTVNLTMTSGGLQHNILPSKLTATFDVRLEPSLGLDEWKEMLNTWAEASGGGIEFEFVNVALDHHALSPDYIDEPNACWTALSKVCERAGIPIEKRIFPGCTDARFVRYFHRTSRAPSSKEPIQTLGFSPMRNTPVLLHDHNECLSSEEFLHGCHLYANLLFELSEL